MAGVTHTVIPPSAADYERAADDQRAALERANARAVDRATTIGAQRMKETIQARGLGRLSGAIGSTSSYKKGQRDGGASWGAVFAKGGDDSLAANALQIYSEGGVISPVKGSWVWFQTDALKRRIGEGRRKNRMTPARYIAAGNPLGPLFFRRKSPQVAELFVKGVLQSAKTGRARLPGVRNRKQTTLVVLFVGLPYTARQQRFDADVPMQAASDQVPDLIADELSKATGG